MGLYEGGLMATVLYLTVIAFFTIGGVMPSTDASTIQFLQCVPDSNNVLSTAGGIQTNQVGQTCVTTTSSITGISSTENGRPDIFAILGNLLIGFVSAISPDVAKLLTLVYFFLTNIFTGWIKIIGIIAGPTSPFVFLLGIPLQIVQMIFVLQFALFVKAFFTNGLSVNA